MCAKPIFMHASQTCAPDGGLFASCRIVLVEIYRCAQGVSMGMHDMQQILSCVFGGGRGNAWNCKIAAGGGGTGLQLLNPSGLGGGAGTATVRACGTLGGGGGSSAFAFFAAGAGSEAGRAFFPEGAFCAGGFSFAATFAVSASVRVVAAGSLAKGFGFGLATSSGPLALVLAFAVAPRACRICNWNSRGLFHPFGSSAFAVSGPGLSPCMQL